VHRTSWALIAVVICGVLAGLVFVIPFFDFNKSPSGEGMRASSRAAIAAVPNKARAMEYEYVDIDSHPWGAEILREMVSLGVLQGYARTVKDEDGGEVTVYYTEPEKTVTRAEFVTLMARTLHLSAESGEASFKDWEKVPQWAKEPAAVLYKMGVIEGYPAGDGGVNFKPDSTVTRAEIAAMIVRMLKEEEDESGKSGEFGESGESRKSGESEEDESNESGDYINKNPFTDVNEEDWFYGPVLDAYRLGIVSGRTPDTFAPRQKAKRVEAMALLLGMLRKDMRSVPDDAQLTSLIRDFYSDMVDKLDGERRSEGLQSYLTAGAELGFKTGGISLLESIPLQSAFPGTEYDLRVIHPDGKPKITFKSGRLARAVYKTKIYWHEKSRNESNQEGQGEDGRSAEGSGEPLNLKTILTEEFYLCRVGSKWKIYRVEIRESKTVQISD